MAKRTTQYLLRVDPDNQASIAHLTETRKATKFINQAIRFYTATLKKHREYQAREPRHKDALAIRLADARDAVRTIRNANPHVTPEIEAALSAILDCFEIYVLPRTQSDAGAETLDDLIEAETTARKAGVAVTGPSDDVNLLPQAQTLSK